MRRIICLIAVIFCFLTGFSGFPQNNSLKKLNETISSLKSDAAMKHSSQGIFIKNISSGKVIADLYAEQSLTPASVMKIATTVAALSILGNDFRFETRLGYKGEIDKEGTLNGDIYIIGGGDPAFGSERFGKDFEIQSIYDNWHKELLKAGIKNIKGSIKADAGIYSDELISGKWFWDDFGNYYGSGACGLNINENLYTVRFKPGRNINDKTTIENINPEMPYLNIDNRVLTGQPGSGDNVIIYGSPYDMNRIASGTIPIDRQTFDVKGSNPDPPYYCAFSFRSYLVKNGISVSGQPEKVNQNLLNDKSGNTEIKIISSHLSPKLEEIIKQTNLKSINIFAEAILKQLAIKNELGLGLRLGLETSKEKLTNKNDGMEMQTSERGIKVVKDFWKERTGDLSGMQMFDGSGLSAADKITPALLVKMLEFAWHDKQIKDAFYNSLPVAGVSGSIKDYFKGTAAENNLSAKSGYMTSVRAYAGYVNNRKGDVIAFSIIVNNYDANPLKMKGKLEKLMIAIAELE